MAKGLRLGRQSEQFITDRSLDRFLDDAKEYITNYPEKMILPDDVAVEKNGIREELSISELPVEGLIADIGEKTIQRYGKLIESAGTVFVNGPPGVYENTAAGTEGLWKAVANTEGYSVIGGGDTISSATRFIDTKSIDYVCTAGGAMIRFLSGVKLPLLTAMQKAYTRDSGKTGGVST